MAALDQYNKNGEMPKRIKKKVKIILIAQKEDKKEDFTAMRKMALRPIEQLSTKEHAILVVK